MNRHKPSQTTGVEAVRKWLLEQGFPLEMRVAEEFRNAGFTVTQSESYVDRESDKAREIDVVAECRYQFGGVAAGLRVVFVTECKRASAKPWVLLSTPELRPAPHSLFHSQANQEGRTLLSNIDQVPDLPSQGVFRGPDRSAYGVTVAFKDRDQKDEAYSACLSVLDALKNRRDIGVGMDAVLSEGGSRRWAHMHFPLIVIEGLLFDAHLDGRGELIVSEINRGRVSQGVTGIGVTGGIIDVVRVSSLREYLETLAVEVEAVERACGMNPELLGNESNGIRDQFARFRHLDCSDIDGAT